VQACSSSPAGKVLSTVSGTLPPRRSAVVGRSRSSGAPAGTSPLSARPRAAAASAPPAAGASVRSSRSATAGMRVAGPASRYSLIGGSQRAAPRRARISGVSLQIAAAGRRSAAASSGKRARSGVGADAVPAPGSAGAAPTAEPRASATKVPSAHWANIARTVGSTAAASSESSFERAAATAAAAELRDGSSVAAGGLTSAGGVEPGMRITGGNAALGRAARSNAESSNLLSATSPHGTLRLVAPHAAAVASAPPRCGGGSDGAARRVGDGERDGDRDATPAAGGVAPSRLVCKRSAPRSSAL
jgi:hypothetical protein